MKSIPTFSSLQNTLIGLWVMVSQLILVSNILAWLYGVSITFGSGEPIDFTSLGFGFSTKLLVLVSVHYVNEYTDYQTDLLTIRAVYSGGSGLPLKRYCATKADITRRRDYTDYWRLYSVVS